MRGLNEREGHFFALKKQNISRHIAQAFGKLALTGFSNPHI
jgi:hypothetical protein